MNPAGRTVIVTGASSGIGAATARSFAAAGANVVLAARSAEALEQLAAELPGRPLVVPADVSRPDDARALVERASSERGQVDILVNNAGVGIKGAVAALNPADLERVLAVDVFGPLYLIQAVIPQMRARRSGQIINVSSLLALRSLPRVGGYAAAKAALERLTEALRMEVLDSGIAVTSVRPGTTRTSFFQQRLGRGRERWKPRGVAPKTVARTIVRAAQHEPRVAYVTLQDRLQVLGAALVPGLTDRVLARLMLWRDED